MTTQRSSYPQSVHASPPPPPQLWPPNVLFFCSLDVISIGFSLLCIAAGVARVRAYSEWTDWTLLTVAAVALALRLVLHVQLHRRPLTPELSSACLAVDFLCASANEVVLRPLYGVVELHRRLVAREAGVERLTRCAQSLGFQTCLLFHYSFTYFLFAAPHPILARYPVREGLVYVLYGPLLASVAECLLVWNLEGRLLPSFVIAHVLLALSTATVYTLICLAVLKRPQGGPGSLLPVPHALLLPVQRFAALLARATAGSRALRHVPAHLGPIFILAFTGSMYPFLKAFTGLRPLVGCGYESGAFFLFFSLLLSVLSMTSNECPLCRFSRRTIG
jgi:hypothetical protein